MLLSCSCKKPWLRFTCEACSNLTYQRTALYPDMGRVRFRQSRLFSAHVKALIHCRVHICELNWITDTLGVFCPHHLLRDAGRGDDGFFARIKICLMAFPAMEEQFHSNTTSPKTSNGDCSSSFLYPLHSKSHLKTKLRRSSPPILSGKLAVSHSDIANFLAKRWSCPYWLRRRKMVSTVDNWSRVTEKKGTRENSRSTCSLCCVDNKLTAKQCVDATSPSANISQDNCWFPDKHSRSQSAFPLCAGILNKGLSRGLLRNKGLCCKTRCLHSRKRVRKLRVFVNCGFVMKSG